MAGRRGTPGRGGAPDPALPAGPVAGGHVPLVESAEHYVPASARLEPHGPLWKVVDAVVLVGVLGMVLTVSLQVVSRSLGAAVPWTEELTRFLFIYTAFLGMAAGFRHADHARIAFVVAKLPRFAQRAAVHLYVAAGVTFFVVVGYQGWELVVQQYESEETSPALGIGMWIATLPIIVSAVLAVLGHLQSVYRSVEIRRRLERGEMTAS
ncbi:TRAP transporter small permease [Geodermatophilus sp. YIM 151500]|uniref:TRAP transporter small permease n=1 Tax=Geodermatophilus sp. YIM 151500 TaxID=2984531 RepID=UPI0021E4E89E|nr:TRAP transporter small permease [Geodermatophilus sp. YIM 151500]MCV2488194.1 TRAP transporter small permease [Geodermatophilus sp. YIM 151500]